MDQAEQITVNETVNKFLAAGIIEQMPTGSEDYLSRLFIIQKRNESIQFSIAGG